MLDVIRYSIKYRLCCWMVCGVQCAVCTFMYILYYFVWRQIWQPQVGESEFVEWNSFSVYFGQQKFIFMVIWASFFGAKLQSIQKRATICSTSIMHVDRSAHELWAHWNWISFAFQLIRSNMYRLSIDNAMVSIRLILESPTSHIYVCWWH